jgi:hypothetical protein
MRSLHKRKNHEPGDATKHMTVRGGFHRMVQREREREREREMVSCRTSEREGARREREREMEVRMIRGVGLGAVRRILEWIEDLPWIMPASLLIFLSTH